MITRNLLKEFDSHLWIILNSVCWFFVFVSFYESKLFHFDWNLLEASQSSTIISFSGLDKSKIRFDMMPVGFSTRPLTHIHTASDCLEECHKWKPCSMIAFNGALCHLFTNVHKVETRPGYIAYPRKIGGAYFDLSCLTSKFVAVGKQEELNQKFVSLESCLLECQMRGDCTWINFGIIGGKFENTCWIITGKVHWIENKWRKSYPRKCTKEFVEKNQLHQPTKKLPFEWEAGLTRQEMEIVELSSAQKTQCLSSKECFPAGDCDSIVDTLGGWKICLSKLSDVSSCLVYSVGIAEEWGFDTFMGNMGCEVHAFDPTVDLRKKDLGENVHFHLWGLTTEDSKNERTFESTDVYGGMVPGSEMLTFKEITDRLGHTNRKIDFFKMDCEGCEWDVLYELGDDVIQFEQILVEFHFTVRLGMDTKRKVEKAAVIYDNLKNNGFGYYYVRENGGWLSHRAILPELFDARMSNHSCCREVHLAKMALI